MCGVCRVITVCHLDPRAFRLLHMPYAYQVQDTRVKTLKYRLPLYTGPRNLQGVKLKENTSRGYPRDLVPRRSRVRPAGASGARQRHRRGARGVQGLTSILHGSGTPLLYP